MGFYFEKPSFFDSYYPRLLLFVSRHSVWEFKTGLAGQLLSFSFNSEIHPLPSTAYLAPGGMSASVPAIWQRRRGHTSDSLCGDRPHTLRPTTSCTQEKLFGFLYCLTHTGFVFALRQPRQAQGCAGCKNHIPERNSWDLWPSWSKAAAVLKQWPGIHVKMMGIFVTVETQSLHIAQLFSVPPVLSWGFSSISPTTQPQSSVWISKKTKQTETASCSCAQRRTWMQTTMR